jgi:hypothetical protein
LAVADAAAAERAAAEVAAAEAAAAERAAAELAAAEAAAAERAAAELAAAERAAAERAAAERAAVEAAVAETVLQTYSGPNEAVEPRENIGSEESGVIIITEPSGTGTARPSSADIGKRVSLGLLNLALGAGSFVQKDWGGGLTTFAGYALAGALIAWELTLIYEDPLAGIPGTVGLGVAASAAIFGFIRPLLFNRNRPEATQVKRINFSFVPGNRGAAVRLSYTLHY